MSGHAQPHTKRLSEDGRARRIQAANAQFFVNEQIKAQFLDIDKHVGWNDKMTVNQVICRRVEDGWQVIIKANRHKRHRLAYVNAETYAAAYELAGEFAARGCLTWHDDKRPPKFFSRR